MMEAVTSVKAPLDSSCCQLSRAPLPQALGAAPAPEASADVACEQQLATGDLRPAQASVPNVPESASPPDRQLLLCVFLI